MGRLDDLRKGEDDLGGDDLEVELEDTSGSSIQAKLDCAMVDRVGRGTGLADRLLAILGLVVVIGDCKSRGGIMTGGSASDSGSGRIGLFLTGAFGRTVFAAGVATTSREAGGFAVCGGAVCKGSAESIKTEADCNGLVGMTSEGSMGRGIVESSR